MTVYVRKAICAGCGYPVWFDTDTNKSFCKQERITETKEEVINNPRWIMLEN